MIDAAPALAAVPGGTGGGTTATVPPAAQRCQRCGFAVSDLVRGCKNPCANCGTVYPLGDCSD